MTDLQIQRNGDKEEQEEEEEKEEEETLLIATFVPFFFLIIKILRNFLNLIFYDSLPIINY